LYKTLATEQCYILLIFFSNEDCGSKPSVVMSLQIWWTQGISPSTSPPSPPHSASVGRKIGHAKEEVPGKFFKT
jgi:hypothetical protein